MYVIYVCMCIYVCNFPYICTSPGTTTVHTVPVFKMLRPAMNPVNVDGKKLSCGHETLLAGSN